MPSTVTFAADEIEILLKALRRFARTDSGRRATARRIAARLSAGRETPPIEIGVYGGLVQWIRGNAAPILVYDYDGDDDACPDIDPEGNRCRRWLEPPDRSASL